MASALEDDLAIYRFGAYELNPRSRQLLRLGRAVAIQPRPFDLLLYLIRHRDRPVPRDELLAQVWRGVHVDDEALRFTLHAARRAVGDDGTRQEVIRTVPRVGYRLVAPLVEVEPSADARATRRDPAPAESPFVGREALMKAAGTLLDAVSGGDGRVLLLSGEAGIGKSRALDEIASIAHAHGIGVLRGRCVESEGAPAFWPWIQILRTAVGSNPPDALLRALGAGAREVAWMVPELRSFAPELPPAPTNDARAARFLMFDSVTAFLRALTLERAFLVSIDDLHRADSASAALFQHVARELGDAGSPRILLVGTHREAELRATPALAETFASVTTLAHARQEQIQGLAPEDVATLVRAHSGREPSATAISDLHRKTNGNPFFLNQILRVLKSESRLTELDSALAVDLELPR
ncbi:MAG TPA: AAA family ATPase, partial [Myxococcota bacterium]|nr:AAA family ATPase [Myxococcota bacterium]